MRLEEESKYDREDLIRDVSEETEKLGIERSYVEEAVNQDYQPSRKEKGLLLKVVKNLDLFAVIPSSLIMLPTNVRRIGGFIQEGYENTGATLLICNCMGTLFTSLAIHGNLFESNPRLAKYVLGTQIATNAISGVYEIFRHKKRKMLEDYSESGESED